MDEVRQDFYAEKPIKIRLKGSYHEFGRFVSDIAALPRIVTLHDIEIAPGRARIRAADELVLNVTAKTYRYLDESETAPAEADAKGAAQKGGRAAKHQRPGRRRKGKPQRPAAKKAG